MACTNSEWCLLDCVMPLPHFRGWWRYMVLHGLVRKRFGAFRLYLSLWINICRAPWELGTGVLTANLQSVALLNGSRIPRPRGISQGSCCRPEENSSGAELPLAHRHQEATVILRISVLLQEIHPQFHERCQTLAYYVNQKRSCGHRNVSQSLICSRNSSLKPHCWHTQIFLNPSYWRPMPLYADLELFWPNAAKMTS